MRKKIKQIFSALLMLVMLTDANTIRNGAAEGLAMCLKTVVPSLFPFLLVSAIFNQNLNDTEFRLLRPVAYICKIPKHCSRYLLIGLFGGYPVGAKCINDGYKAGNLSKENAQRLLGFCSNAGPSFIFGIIGFMVDIKSAVWALWVVHILSAIAVGMILPEVPSTDHSKQSASSSGADMLTQSIKTMAIICTWVIVFKTVLLFMNKYLMHDLPDFVVTILCGFIEMTNGCIGLQAINCQGIRFVLSAVYIAFGGICVSMQTLSVTKDVGCGMYFYGKVLQTIISFILSYCLQYVFWTRSACLRLPWGYIATAVFLMFFILFLIKRKKF